MIPAGLLVHTATRVRPAVSVDGHGDTVKDYGAGAARSALVCRLEPLKRVEDPAGTRDSTDETWWLFTNQTDLAWDDRIEWADHPRGQVVFEVMGPPAPEYGATAAGHHTEASLRIQAG